MPRLTNNGNELSSEEKSAIRDDLGVTEALGDKVDLDGLNAGGDNTFITNVGGLPADGSVPIDFINLGEITDAILDEGSISRDGLVMKIHDGVTPGGLSIGGQKNYLRCGGYRLLIPFGASGSVAKQAGASNYWHEIARFWIPGNLLQDGNLLTMRVGFRHEGAALGATTRTALLVPALLWDHEPQSDYFGASPVSDIFSGAASPAFLPFRMGATSSTKSVSQVERTHVVTVQESGGLYSIYLPSSSAGTTQYGYDFTGAATFTGTDTNGWSATSLGDWTPGEDFEVVLVAEVTAVTTEYREAMWYVSFDITEP